MAPDGIFSEKEYIQLQKDISTYSNREEFIPYFFIVKSFDINGVTNITQYFDAILEKMELDLTILLMQEVFNYQELFIILVSIE
jgi:hypothetical protein